MNSGATAPEKNLKPLVTTQIIIKKNKLKWINPLEIVKSFGYTGYIGVEYEGLRLSEVEGIKATRDLLIKAGKSI